MTDILDQLEGDLKNSDAQFFILDTGNDAEIGDVDFEKYSWQTNKYNLVREGDWFIYRRPSNVSETRKFYFFGVCKIRRIASTSDVEKRVTATFSRRIPFEDVVRQEDLENYRWNWKDRGATWEHFFNQYGMNKIPKADFEYLLGLGLGESSDLDTEAEVEATQAIQKKNYSAEDGEAKVKVRSKQSVFSNKVKLNYSFQCAITGIRTKRLLVGSHIIPWSKRKETRLDPRNGICLSVLLDKLFDVGYISIDKNYKVILSSQVKSDPVLFDQIKQFIGVGIKMPRQDKPLQEYLDYHRDVLFKA